MTLGYYSTSGVGSITTSPTKSIVFTNYTATPTFPTPLPAPEISDQQVAVDGDNVFFVHSNNTSKLLVSKHLRSNPSTILNSFAVTAAIPFSPSVRYIDNKVVLSYCTYTISFTEILEMFVDVLNPSDLSLVTRTSRGFPDPSPDTFRPRLAVSGGVVHRVYVRFDNNIFIENFNPSTNITRDPFPTNISYTGGDLLGVALAGATDPLDKTVYLIYPQTTNLNVRRYSNENYVTPTWSVGSITGGLPAEIKTHPIGRVNQANDALYLSTTSGGTKGVIIKLQASNGQVQWNTTTITVPSSTRVTQGMDVFEGFPMMYTILSSNNSLVVSKVNDEGSLVSSRTTPLTGFDYTTNVSGLSPFVVSLYPWNHITVFHNTNVAGLNYSAGRDVAIRAYTATPVNALPATNNEVRTSQGVYEDEGSAQVTEYTVASGTSLYYFNGLSITNTRVISNVAYRPSVAKLPADDFLINAYAKTFNTFTEVHTINLRQVLATSSLTDGWIRDDQLILPEGSNGTIRPLVRVYASVVFLVYVRETGKMVIERRDRETGALIDRLATPHIIPEASELVIGGDYDLCIAHTMKPLFPTKFKVIKYEFGADPTQPLVQRFATEYEELNGLQVNSLEIIQNISENIMVTYLAFDPSINLQRAFIVRISQVTGNKLLSIEYGGVNIENGQRRWTIAPTERLSGIDNEGSFTNSARASIVVESGVTSIKADLFETNPSFKTIRYNFSLFNNKPAYLNTPLVMYNKGEGWAIIAYRATDNTFRIFREQVGTGSRRVNYDSRGYATNEAYDYWWRPLITINPSIRGSDIEENVVVSSGTRVSRRWHANGHLYFVKQYSWYNINDANNWLDLIENSNPAIRISVPPGRYNITQVLNILLTGMNTLGSKTYKYILDPITKRVTWTFMLEGSVSFGFSAQAGESLATVLGFEVTPLQQVFPLLLSATYTRTDKKVTITTPTAHGFPVGYEFVIVGSTGGLSNGTYKVSTVISPTQFTILDTVSGTASGSTNIQQITGSNPANLVETNNISGPEYYFSKNGQWAREVVNHSGDSYLREWTLPERTDVEAVFRQFDTNNDGLIATSGAGNELDVGLSSYGISIPPQERVLLVNAMNPDEQGRVGLSRFSLVMPTNEYTRDIFTKIGRDQVIKTLDCEIVNGVRSSHSEEPFGCKEYFSLLPANRLLRESNYLNGKLVGTVNQYFNTGVLENVKVYNNAGKITSNTTNWPNGNKKEEVVYDPPGVESGVRFSYDTDGTTILAQTIIETTRPDNPNIKLRVTTFWSAGVRRVEYYLDVRRQRTDVYREFFNTNDIPQKISLQGNYFRGKRVGSWLTYNIAGQVIKTEVFPPYRP
jgi:antitoxin component YwqK of YwqJK toxin-antitoxin module